MLQALKLDDQVGFENTSIDILDRITLLGFLVPLTCITNGAVNIHKFM